MNKLPKQLSGYSKPVWDEFAGINGAYVATSHCGNIDAIAEPTDDGFLCFFVRTSDGETLKQELVEAV